MSEKILVIDDEEDVRIFLTTVLRRNGYEVLSASNGVEGLEIARRERPALVTLDLLMPKRSGADFYQNLAADETLRGTPVIVISGLQTRKLAVADPVAVFDKPIDPKAFIEAVKQALQGEKP